MYDTKKYIDKPREYYKEERNDIIPFVPQNINFILDVGCSGGFFGKKLKEIRDNIIVWGVEPNEEAASIAKNNLDKVVCAPFSENLEELHGQLFDCIIFNDVLEHLVSPEDVLRSSSKLLKKNGLVLASLPNVLFFPVLYDLVVGKDWKYEKSGVLDNTHLRFFTRKSIVRLFEENGYKVKKIKGINVKIHDRYRFYQFLNILTFNFLKESKYMQIVVIAEKK